MSSDGAPRTSVARIGTTRFAPSLTGLAHPGTLLSALLVWLDGTQRGDRLVLRLEDLDRQRLKPHFKTSMLDALDWLGLAWDRVVVQSECAEQHEAALDTLAELGVLYACTCSRSALRAQGRRAPDGGWAYDNRCRHRSVGGDWRNIANPLRCRLPDAYITPSEDRDSKTRTTQNPAEAMGDPIVRRRDGVSSYHLASVADDIALGVTRVVRGHDLAASTATQVALYRLLDSEPPAYRHHLLLLERSSNKLSKMHGALSFDDIRSESSAPLFLGRLAHLAGLALSPVETTPTKLLDTFCWNQVKQADVVFTEMTTS